MLGLLIISIVVNCILGYWFYQTGTALVQVHDEATELRREIAEEYFRRTGRRAVDGVVVNDEGLITEVH